MYLGCCKQRQSGEAEYKPGCGRLRAESSGRSSAEVKGCGTAGPGQSSRVRRLRGDSESGVLI